MEMQVQFCLMVVLAVLLFDPVLGCDRCVHHSKIALANSAASTVTVPGACGYGLLQSGNVAAAAPWIYRKGVGCGACYQMRCRNPSLCTKNGIKVLVTGVTHSNDTAFVVPATTFSSMAMPGKAAAILKAGTMDAEYKRIPCNYGNQKMVVRVLSSSRFPFYLAIQFLRQGGQTDIVEVDVAWVGSADWKFMSRVNGSVWEIKNPPEGDLQMRFVVTSGYDGKWIWAKNRVIPADWKPEKIYNSGIQISDIAQEGCFPCDNSHWTG